MYERPKSVAAATRARAALSVFQSGAAAEEARRLDIARRTYQLVSWGLPVLLALLVWRIKLQSLSKYGEVEYGVAGGESYGFYGELRRTFCETYPR